MSLDTDNKINANYERIASLVGGRVHANPRSMNLTYTPPLNIPIPYSGDQRAKHDYNSFPKTGGPQLNGIMQIPLARNRSVWEDLPLCRLHLAQRIWA